MRSALLIMTILLSLPVAAVPVDETFKLARQAYDEGRYEEAAGLYEELTDQGFSNREIHYNMANAFFKNGTLPEAVLNYRKAWYQAPRDPEIRANMQFALNAAGAVEPAAGWIERSLTALSKNEWIAIAAGGYLLLFLLLMAVLVTRSARRALLKVSLIPCIGIAAAGAGWWHWHGLANNPEGVILSAGTTALYAPMDAAEAYFKVPKAALVRQIGSDPKGWTEIQYDNKSGWIRNRNIELLYP